MTRYNDLQDHPAFAKFRRVPSSVLETDTAAGLPEAYVDLLRQLGWGDFGPGQLMFYTGAIDWDDVYSGEPPIGKVFLVADDYQGYTYGFLDGQFTSFDPSGTSEREDMDFEAWLRWQLARSRTRGDA